MNAAETLAALQEAGISLQVEDTSIVASPSSRLTDPLRAAIRANKPAIIAKLSGGPAYGADGATADLWNLDTPAGAALVHQQCAKFLPKPEAAEPSTAYEAVSAGPEGGCRVTIIELPQAQRYRQTFAHLQLKPPALVDVARWRQCVEDGKRFLAAWGSQAEALGWSARDLFGLHQPPEQPHPSYRRLSRYDCTGLVWLLEGRPVVALTADTASIRHPTGGITTYRKHNKPALGPAGDDIFDIDPGWRQ